MRVLHVLSSIDPRVGGPAEALRGLARAQADAGLRVRVLSSFAIDHDNSEIAQELRAAGVGVRLVGPARGRRASHPQTRAACEQECELADIVHIHALWESIQSEAARAAYRSGTPYLFRPCGMLDPWSLSQRRWLKELFLMGGLRGHLRRAAALHYTTRIEAEGGTRLGFPGRVIIEPNGVGFEVNNNPTLGASFRHRWAIPKECPLLLFLGRLHYKKGLDFLFEAIAKLREQGVEFRLILAGGAESSYENEVSRMLLELAVEDRVIRIGVVAGQEKQAALQAADLFILSSRHENFGVAVAEAMAAGLPVIVSDQVALHREVESIGAGLVMPLDASKFANAISSLLESPEKRGEFGAKGKAFARVQFDWALIARRWVKHYNEIAAV